MTRNARAILFTIAFPIILYVLFATVFAKKGNSTTSFHGTQIKTDAYFLAGMIAYAIMMSAFSTICISLTTQRESGLLKRFRGTPLAPWAFIAAQVVRSILLTIVEVVALLIIGR